MTISRGLGLIIFLLLFHVPLQAQYRLGFSAGYTYSTWGGSDVASGSKGISGPVFGAFLDNNEEGFGIRPQLLYIGKGVNFQGDDQYFPGPFHSKGKLRINYFELVMPASYRFQPIHGAIPQVYLGPYFSSLSSSSFSPIADTVVSSDVESVLRGSDYGIVAGAGIQMESGTLLYGINLMYHHGFLAAIASDAFAVYNRSFTIQAEIRF